MAKEKSFKKWQQHGFYDRCSWLYINMFAPEMSGIPITTALGNHVEKIDEFKKIFDIYEKYDGKEVFAFHKERFDCD